MNECEKNRKSTAWSIVQQQFRKRSGRDEYIAGERKKKKKKLNESDKHRTRQMMFVPYMKMTYLQSYWGRDGHELKPSTLRNLQKQIKKA